MNHKPTRPTVGPRGGRAVQATPCAECVSWRSCRPASISEPFGCESWADQDGRRALPDELKPEPASPCEPCQGVPSECGPCGCPEVELDPYCPRCGQLFALHNGDGSCLEDEPDPEPPYRPAAPYRPDPGRGEATAQGVLPMADAGPLFAGCPEVRR